MWVFGYGSLLWDPGFAPAEVRRARIAGHVRSFCMLSIHYRGTEAEPGLVLALRQAGPEEGCDGLAFRADPAAAAAVLAGLRVRELISNAYLERRLPVRLETGEEVTAVTYVIDPGHRQHCAVDADTQAAMIARASGARGPNADYLFRTAAELSRLGIADPGIEALVSRVRTILGG